MPPTGLESGIIKTIVSGLLKPFDLIFTPIAERIGSWLQRKPELHVHFHPLSCFWCLAQNGNQELMQIVFRADFTHDSRRETMVIVGCYPKKTKPFHPFEKFRLPPEVLQEEYSMILVSPVIGTKGKDWIDYLIFIDQFGRKHKSPKYTFKWAGPPSETVAR